MNPTSLTESLRPRVLLALALTLGACVLAVAGASLAWANWSGDGPGVGAASVDTLAAPTTVTVSSSLSTVSVSWSSVSAPTGSLTGYFVTRYAGSVALPACGTDPGTPATFVAGTSCTDLGVGDGTYTYKVTAVFRSWTATSIDSNVVTVVGDSTLPSQTVMLSPGAVNASLVGTTVYFRSAAAGSFGVSATVTDGQSGPASATFPAVTASGWLHAAETVTVGSSAGSSTTYSSSSNTWNPGAATPGTYTIVGRDASGNTVGTSLSFSADDTAPTGGSLSVNGAAATGAGSTSTARAAFTIGGRVDYASDTGSGVATSVLVRESATLSNGTCGAFATPVVITGTPAQSGLTTGCYRYTLTGTDRVGNASSVTTVVRYDTTAPTQAVTMSSANGASITGTVIYYRSTVAGSFVLNTAVTDAESGPLSATYPVLATAGWTHPVQTVNSGTGAVPTVTYPSSTFSWTAAPTRPGTYTVTGSDAAGNTVATALTWTTDTTAPTGGALTVNAVAATAAGSTSFNRTGSFTIGTRTDYTDAASGIASSVLTVQSAVLTNNTCGSFGSPSVLAGAPAQSGLTTGCWKYVLTGTDKVGNVATRTTTVKVDLVMPASGALTVNGTAAAGTSTSSSANAAYPIDLRTDWVDAESGIATSTLTRQAATFTAGACGTYGASTTLTGTPLQTGLTTACYRYTLTGTDRAGNAISVSTIVRYDVTAPTGGALTVNGVAATTAGSTSTSTSPSFTIGTRTNYTDAASGLVSSVLTQQFAPTTGTTCGTFGTATVVSGNPTQSGLATGCYRYTLTGTDVAGNVASLSTTVSVRPYVTALSLVNGGAVAGRADVGDQVVVTFSDSLSVASICSAWVGDTSNQVLNGDNQLSVALTNGGAANDTITVTSSACTFSFGTINLGSTAYTTANVTFGGAAANRSTAAWNATTHQLTITLGAASGAGVATVASSTPVITPSAVLTNPSAVPVGGSFTAAAARQF
ncbi:MAG: hypothetical protein WAN48_09735 [Actinomycetes bacterium]